MEGHTHSAYVWRGTRIVSACIMPAYDYEYIHPVGSIQVNMHRCAYTHASKYTLDKVPQIKKKSQTVLVLSWFI